MKPKPKPTKTLQPLHDPLTPNVPNVRRNADSAEPSDGVGNARTKKFTHDLPHSLRHTVSSLPRGPKVVPFGGYLIGFYI